MKEILLKVGTVQETLNEIWVLLILIFAMFVMEKEKLLMDIYGGINMQRYLDIINHFGLKNQLKKLNEETYELIEAINEYENLLFENEVYNNPYSEKELNIYRDCLVDELSDVLLLLTQVVAKYTISKYEVDEHMDIKLERTEKRIKNGYYEKDDNNE